MNIPLSNRTRSSSSHSFFSLPSQQLRLLLLWNCFKNTNMLNYHKLLYFWIKERILNLSTDRRGGVYVTIDKIPCLHAAKNVQKKTCLDDINWRYITIALLNKMEKDMCRGFPSKKSAVCSYMHDSRVTVILLLLSSYLCFMFPCNFDKNNYFYTVLA